jgi:trimethylamine--corrinoid protein Co-methyltransferase
MNDETPSRSAGRSGGRAARRAARAAPLAANMRPIRPGMDGGHYNPLTDIDVQNIHEAALTALETIGLADAPPSGVAYLTSVGAIEGEDGRIRFPRTLIEDTIAKANRSMTLHSRDGLNDLDLGGSRVHYGTAGAAVHLVDVHGRHYRESTIQDLHDAAHICDTLDRWLRVTLLTTVKWNTTVSLLPALERPNTSACPFPNQSSWHQQLKCCT